MILLAYANPRVNRFPISLWVVRLGCIFCLLPSLCHLPIFLAICWPYNNIFIILHELVNAFGNIRGDRTATKIVRVDTRVLLENTVLRSLLASISLHTAKVITNVVFYSTSWCFDHP